jgi:hypothetical protein
VLIAADDALKSATEARNWISEKADKKFAMAIDLLSDFEMDFPSKDPTSDPNIGKMTTRPGEANTSDTSKSPSKILCSLKKNLHAKVKFYPFLYLSTLTNVTNPSPWAMNGRN